MIDCTKYTNYKLGAHRKCWGGKDKDGQNVRRKFSMLFVNDLLYHDVHQDQEVEATRHGMSVFARGDP